MSTNRLDRIKAILANVSEPQASSAQPFEALSRADRDRALNTSEHRAFRETLQTLLAKIFRLPQTER